MSAAIPRVLQVAHGHTAFHPGGTEMVALALHRYWRSQEQDCWYLGAAESSVRASHPGTRMIALSDDQREAVIHVDDFLRFRLEQQDYFGSLREFANALATIRPDVVHFHHVLNFGLEAIHLTRQVLPRARIVVTLHDYYLICANNGQLYKHHTRERCRGPSLSACMSCIPTVGAEDFRMRSLDIGRTIALADRVVAPSMFLRDMIEANLDGCPPISLVENTYVGPQSAVAERPAGDGPMRFAYFGNLSLVKGIGDLLEAAAMLLDRGTDHFTVQVHGSQLFTDAALDEKIANGKARLGDKLQFMGRYDQDDLAQRMADAHCVVFPSLWWENAPLVIYEALHHGRRIISYPHGGAAEILNRYGTGVLAEASHPAALADAMQKSMAAAMSRQTVERATLRSMAEFAADYAEIYAT